MAKNSPAAERGAFNPDRFAYSPPLSLISENRPLIFSNLSDMILLPGFAATCFAFYHASLSVRAGDHYRTNRMFRYRIYGQAFTLVAVVAGSYYYNADRILRKEYEAIKAEQKAKEKNEAWIKELEFRDKEEREEKERQMKVNRTRERRRQLPEGTTSDDWKEKSNGNGNGNNSGGVLESVREAKEGKVLQELKKVTQDATEAVNEIFPDTKKEEDTTAVVEDTVDTKKEA